MIFSWQSAKNIIVLGGGHGIGLQWVKSLHSSYPNLNILATYRQPDKALQLIKLSNTSHSIKSIMLDPEDKESLSEFSESIASLEIEASICCFGVLHTQEMQPEKSLNQIDIDDASYVMKVNGIYPVVMAATLKNNFRHKRPSIFVSLSARVGSIADNRLGGWYSYRASKAALNMYLKTAAIEYQRYSCNTGFISLHPGTVDTDLSKPFTGPRYKNQVFSPAEAVGKMHHAIEGVEFVDGESIFIDYDGKSIPW